MERNIAIEDDLVKLREEIYCQSMDCRRMCDIADYAIGCLNNLKLSLNRIMDKDNALEDIVNHALRQTLQKPRRRRNERGEKLP